MITVGQLVYLPPGLHNSSCHVESSLSVENTTDKVICVLGRSLNLSIVFDDALADWPSFFTGVDADLVENLD